MNYIGTVMIVALIFYVFGRSCVSYGRRKGFAKGCRYERDLGSVSRNVQQRRPAPFWTGYN